MLKKYLWGALAGLLAAGCAGRETGGSYTVVDGTMLGTTLHIVADVRGTSAQELYASVMELDREAKASMSIFDSTSLLSRLNRNETDSVDRHIAFNLRLADSIGALSGGCYDVTVKPLVEAWGFAGKAAQAHPNIDSILTFVGRDKVRIEEGRLVKSDPRVQLDFNSVAKGYTVDLLAALVERHGARNYIVDIGGEIRCRGVNREGKAWRIGVETPFDGNMSDGRYLQRRIAMHEGGMATSGNYRRYYLDAGGRKVAHTIDPRTGRSALSRLLSVTVVAPTCAEADALGTMFLAMGADGALEAVRKMPDAKVYFIFAGKEGGDSYEEYLSPAMERLILE
ncbi:FAD:protein FMN transferase [Alistipes sp.]|uniref:FAD:protein FMN transferase n=1 Tax=Alistipes sp. TaxID=1872444 RepID=UPI0025C6AEB7|nr:FAD:protein FMN transferase [Alistipes sp.]